VITLLTPGHYFLHAFAMGFAIIALCDVGLNLGDRLALHGELEFTPGVALVDSSQFSVNGQRTTSNYMMIDGVSANTSVISASSIDAPQEFRIQTSSYAPEFGRTPDGQVWTYFQLLVLIAELLVLAALLMLLLMSHVIKLTKWAFEEVDDFRKWWAEFKGRRR
jgi:hypothetical protein